jgi:hypothetical protein
MYSFARGREGREADAREGRDNNNDHLERTDLNQVDFHYKAQHHKGNSERII